MKLLRYYWGVGEALQCPFCLTAAILQKESKNPQWEYSCDFCPWDILEGSDCFSAASKKLGALLENEHVAVLRITRNPEWCAYSIKRLNRWLKKIEKMEKENDKETDKA
jgi:hypothetical protein